MQLSQTEKLTFKLSFEYKEKYGHKTNLPTCRRQLTSVAYSPKNQTTRSLSHTIHRV